jgi:hypothetical protein
VNIWTRVLSPTTECANVGCANQLSEGSFVLVMVGVDVTLIMCKPCGDELVVGLSQ